jgi:hypothetical protein
MPNEDNLHVPDNRAVTLTIRRTKFAFAFFRQVRVFAKGTYLGQIAGGQDIVLSLTSGDTVEVEIHTMAWTNTFQIFMVKDALFEFGFGLFDLEAIFRFSKLKPRKCIGCRVQKSEIKLTELQKTFNLISGFVLMALLTWMLSSVLLRCGL